jgi:hypothetical protein
MTVLPDIMPIPDDPVVKVILSTALKALGELGRAGGAAQLALDALQSMSDLNQIAGRAYFGAHFP